MMLVIFYSVMLNKKAIENKPMKPIYRYYLQDNNGYYLKYIQGSIFYKKKFDFEGAMDYTSFNTRRNARLFRDSRLNNPYDWNIICMTIIKCNNHE